MTVKHTHLFHLANRISIYNTHKGIFHFELLVEWKQIFRLLQKIWVTGIIGITEAVMLIMCDDDLTEYMLIGHGQGHEYEQCEWKGQSAI